MAKKTKIKRTMFDVLNHLDNDKSDKQICAYLKITPASLAAFKANLSRQNYLPRSVWTHYAF